MNKQTQELLPKIMALVYEVNENTTTDVFVHLSGHAKAVDITLYINGRDKEKNSSNVNGCNINGTINLSNKKMLNKAVDVLEGLLK